MTTYLLMNSAEPTQLHRNCVTGYWKDSWFETERGAKGVATRELKKSGIKYVPITYQEWNEKYNNMVEVVSLMSGKPVMIRLSERGGCCDPSTERYWSM